MEGYFINVRKLVALDISFHSKKFILIEYGVGTPLLFVFGIQQILFGSLIFGLYLVLVGMNYLPLLIYSIIISRGNTAEKEIADVMAQPDKYRKKYLVQVFLLFIPLAMFLLASFQELRKS